MKKKALVLASYVAFTTPSISIAQALPITSVGLNLGEINATSYLDQPFKGVIPFLFTSIEGTRQLSVRLAPQSVFDKVGAEKLPILNQLKFRITSQANKPIIQITSNTPIQLPFLNFILEIEGPNGILYQDYTVLLDPKDDSSQTQFVQEQPTLFEMPDTVANNEVSDMTQNDNFYFAAEEVNTNDLPITYSSTSLVTHQEKIYKVRSGDSLSRIASRYKPNDISLKRMMSAIFTKNPKAFIRGDIDKIKRGVVLNLPTHKELTGLNNIAKKVDFEGTTPKVADVSLNNGQYKVVKGDSLFAITKKFRHKNTSFTKMMNAIFVANPDAFSKHNKNQLNAGATLRIPTLDEIATTSTSEVTTVEKTSAHTPSITTVSISSEQAAPKVEAKTIEAENTSVLKPHQYRVQKGDTLAQITKDIGYEGTSFTKMMKTIYSENKHAFERNNITKLKVGAVLNLPDPNKTPTETATETAKNSVQTNLKDNSESKIKIETTTTLGTTDLEKRIRELRIELEKAKSRLEKMDSEITNKENIISTKNNQLVNLKSLLAKLRLAQDTEKIVENPNIMPEEIMAEDEVSEVTPEEDNITQVSALDESEQILVDMPKRGFNYTLSSAIQEHFEDSSAKNLAYLSMALILGLLLLRYRREIYSYTAINYDGPKYYPAPDVYKDYGLTQRNISYQEPSKKENTKTVEELVEELNETTNHQVDTDLYHETVNEFGTESISTSIEDEVETETVNYLENTETEETKSIAKESEEEQLVTKLFCDLNAKPNSIPEISTNTRKWPKIEDIASDYSTEKKDNLEKDNDLSF